MTGAIPCYQRREIGWKHFMVNGATIEWCGQTGEALRTIVEERRRDFVFGGVKILLTVTMPAKTRIAKSHEIHMNGVLPEDLPAASVVSPHGPSCGKAPGAGNDSGQKSRRQQ